MAEEEKNKMLLEKEKKIQEIKRQHAAKETLVSKITVSLRIAYW